MIGRGRIAFVGVFQTGLPFTSHTTAQFRVGGDFNADDNICYVPNAPAFGNPIKGASKGDFQRGLLKGPDFRPPPEDTEGDLGRSTFQHPGYATSDLQLVEVFRIP